MAKKKTKKKIAYFLLMISSFFLIFNNMGQFLTFINIPFTQKTQMFTSILGIIIGFVWYSYLEGVLK